eukprot:4162441-Amphidinium_carterae.1
MSTYGHLTQLNCRAETSETTGKEAKRAIRRPGVGGHIGFCWWWMTGGVKLISMAGYVEMFASYTHVGGKLLRSNDKS